MNQKAESQFNILCQPIILSLEQQVFNKSVKVTKWRKMQMDIGWVHFQLCRLNTI